MPPSGFDDPAANAICAFCKANYESLLAEWRSGKYKTIEEAMEAELAKLRKLALKIHVDDDGNLTQR